MKTIEDAAREYSETVSGKHYRDLIVGFRGGVIFAEEWISVEDELPNEDNGYYLTPVLAKDIFGNYRTAIYDGFIWDSTRISDGVITHWRPINRK